MFCCERNATFSHKEGEHLFFYTIVNEPSVKGPDDCWVNISILGMCLVTRVDLCHVFCLIDMIVKHVLGCHKVCVIKPLLSMIVKHLKIFWNFLKLWINRNCINHTSHGNDIWHNMLLGGPIILDVPLSNIFVTRVHKLFGRDTILSNDCRRIDHSSEPIIIVWQCE